VCNNEVLWRFHFTFRRVSSWKLPWRIRSFKKVNMRYWVVWTRKSRHTCLSDVQFKRTFEPCFAFVSAATQKCELSSESASTTSRTLSRNVSLFENLSSLQNSMSLRIPMHMLNIKRFQFRLLVVYFKKNSALNLIW